MFNNIVTWKITIFRKSQASTSSKAKQHTYSELFSWQLTFNCYGKYATNGSTPEIKIRCVWGLKNWFLSFFLALTFIILCIALLWSIVQENPLLPIVQIRTLITSFWIEIITYCWPNILMVQKCKISNI